MTNVKLDVFFNSTDQVHSMSEVLLVTEDRVLDSQFWEDIKQAEF